MRQGQFQAPFDEPRSVNLTALDRRCLLILPHPQRVAENAGLHAPEQSTFRTIPFARLERMPLQAVFPSRAYVERYLLQHHFARLDLGKIQNVVEQPSRE